jgi:fatty acid kinase fatty acid binding subunit
MSDKTRTVAVVTDSTSDIPADLAAAEGITVIPLITTFPDGASFRDGELTQAEFFERMGRAKALPTTSQPPVGEFADVYGALLETFSSVVSIHVSNRLSGTIESARNAAAQFGERVAVFDSLNLSTALGWQVIEAARTAARGAGADEVLKAAEAVRSRVRHVIGLDKLDNLARGGRIGAVSAFMGGLLDLKVLFTVDPEGAFKPVTRVRGHKAAMRETLEFVKREMGGATKGRFFVAHAMSHDTAVYLRDAIAATYEAVEMTIVETGVVIATHTGTGWGIGFVPGD